MEALYHQTNILLESISRELGRLEKADDHSASSIENDIRSQLDQVISNCEQLDLVVYKEPVSRRASAKMRVDQLRYDCQHLQAAVRNLQHKRHTRAQADRERDLLLNRNSTDSGGNTAAIAMDTELQHHSRMTGAHSRVDEMMETSSHVLSSLRQQGGRLKGVQRKVLDMANSLGLSNTVLRLIERRTQQDWVVLVAGMALTCFIMYWVWYYLA